MNITNDLINSFASSATTPTDNSSEDLKKSKKNKTVSKPYFDIPYQLDACDKNDPRNFRPLSVKLWLAIHNINGHLVMDLEENKENLSVFPIGFTDRLALELDKTYTETKLQLYVDPVNIFIVDGLKRNYDKNICQGNQKFLNYSLNLSLKSNKRFLLK